MSPVGRSRLDHPDGPQARSRTRRSCPTTISTARCGRAGSTTSSARRRSRTSSRSRSRPPRAAARRSTTCCSPGPPGLGKTSLAQIVAAELEVPFVQTAGPALERKGDVAAFLTALEPRSVFFVDEIHRLPRALEETFYPAMEDGCLPITVGQGAGARVVTLPLPPFTLIGATTSAGLLTTPLRDRFGIQHRLEHYDLEELSTIVRRSARLLEVEIEDDGARRDRPAQPRHPARRQPAAQARPRLRRGPRHGRGHRARSRSARSTCSRSTTPGLDRLDREILRAICEKFGGGPVGLSTLAVVGGRGTGHDRGRVRALPAPARPDRAHAARTGRDPARIRAPRNRASGPAAALSAP